MNPGLEDAEIAFTIAFHGPFRVGTGRARGGVDAVVDLDDPLPAAHLKGIVRSTAVRLLGLERSLVEGVFGTAEAGGAASWAWDSAHPMGGTWHDVPLTRHTRIAVDDATGTVRPDHLSVAEQLWPTPEFRARFTVTAVRPLADGERSRHAAVLRSAARATHALGSQRRRGLGWVTVRPEVDDTRAAAAADLRAVRQGDTWER